MKNYLFLNTVAALSLAASFTGCSNLPGDKGSQGAVIGGVSGAAVGAAVGGGKHRVLGAIIGGAAGAAGGYVVGANSDKILGKDKDSAEASAQQSVQNPATAEQARTASTGDVNNDGFVTLDEVVALEQAGLTDAAIIQKLQATGQVFELTEDHKKYLRERGVSETVIGRMGGLNQDKRDKVLQEQQGVISRDPASVPPVR